MAKKRKSATASQRKAKAKRKGKTKGKSAARKKTSPRKAVKRAAARKPARRTARTRKAAQPQGIGARIAHAFDSVFDTLADAERLHTQTARKGVQEIE
jgi:hypothetical protein